MRALIMAAGIIASAVSSATARAEDVDWKEIGVATVGGGEIVVCFYDTVSIIYAGSHTRVWVKCIRQQDVEDTIADKGVLGKKIVDNAARKIISGYVPPLVVVGGIDSQQSLTVIVGYEAAANIGAMPTHSRVLYELNCSERMIRRLSTYFHIGGSEAFDEKPQDWEHVPPEGDAPSTISSPSIWAEARFQLDGQQR